MSSEIAVKKACNRRAKALDFLLHSSVSEQPQASGSATATAEILNDAYLFVKLNVDGFELLLDITGGVLILHLGEGLALRSLFRLEVAYWGLGHGVKRHIGVLGISNLIEFYV